MQPMSYFDLLSRVSPAQSALRAAESSRLFTTSPRKLHRDLAPSVRALVEFVRRRENGFLRIYIGNMLDEANRKHAIPMKTPADFFQQLDNALHSYPKYDANFMAALPFYTILQPFMENSYGYYLFTDEAVRRSVFARVMANSAAAMGPKCGDAAT